MASVIVTMVEHRVLHRRHTRTCNLSLCGYPFAAPINFLLLHLSLLLLHGNTSAMSAPTMFNVPALEALPIPTLSEYNAWRAKVEMEKALARASANLVSDSEIQGESGIAQIEQDLQDMHEDASANRDEGELNELHENEGNGNANSPAPSISPLFDMGSSTGRSLSAFSSLEDIIATLKFEGEHLTTYDLLRGGVGGDPSSSPVTAVFSPSPPHHSPPLVTISSTPSPQPPELSPQNTFLAHPEDTLSPPMQLPTLHEQLNYNNPEVVTIEESKPPASPPLGVMVSPSHVLHLQYAKSNRRSPNANVLSENIQMSAKPGSVPTSAKVSTSQSAPGKLKQSSSGSEEASSSVAHQGSTNDQFTQLKSQLQTPNLYLSELAGLDSLLVNFKYTSLIPKDFHASDENMRLPPFHTIKKSRLPRSVFQEVVGIDGSRRYTVEGDSNLYDDDVPRWEDIDVVPLDGPSVESQQVVASAPKAGPKRRPLPTVSDENSQHQQQLRPYSHASWQQQLIETGQQQQSATRSRTPGYNLLQKYLSMPPQTATASQFTSGTYSPQTANSPQNAPFQKPSLLKRRLSLRGNAGERTVSNEISDFLKSIQGSGSSSPSRASPPSKDHRENEKVFKAPRPVRKSRQVGFDGGNAMGMNQSPYYSPVNQMTSQFAPGSSQGQFGMSRSNPNTFQPQYNQQYSQTGQATSPQYSQTGQMPFQYSPAGEQIPPQYPQGGPMAFQYPQVRQAQPPQYTQGTQMPFQYSQSGQVPQQYSYNGQLPPQYSQAGQMRPQFSRQGGQITPQYSQANEMPPPFTRASQSPIQYTQTGQVPPQTVQVGQVPSQYFQSNQMPRQYPQQFTPPYFSKVQTSPDYSSQAQLPSQYSSQSQYPPQQQTLPNQILPAASQGMTPPGFMPQQRPMLPLQNNRMMSFQQPQFQQSPSYMNPGMGNPRMLPPSSMPTPGNDMNSRFTPEVVNIPPTSSYPAIENPSTSYPRPASAAPDQAVRTPPFYPQNPYAFQNIPPGQAIERENYDFPKDRMDGGFGKIRGGWPGQARRDPYQIPERFASGPITNQYAGGGIQPFTPQQSGYPIQQNVQQQQPGPFPPSRQQLEQPVNPQQFASGPNTGYIGSSYPQRFQSSTPGQSQDPAQPQPLYFPGRYQQQPFGNGGRQVVPPTPSQYPKPSQYPNPSQTPFQYQQPQQQFIPRPNSQGGSQQFPRPAFGNEANVAAVIPRQQLYGRGEPAPEVPSSPSNQGYSPANSFQLPNTRPDSERRGGATILDSKSGGSQPASPGSNGHGRGGAQGPGRIEPGTGGFSFPIIDDRQQHPTSHVSKPQPQPVLQFAGGHVQQGDNGLGRGQPGHLSRAGDGTNHGILGANRHGSNSAGRPAGNNNDNGGVRIPGSPNAIPAEANAQQIENTNASPRTPASPAQAKEQHYPEPGRKHLPHHGGDMPFYSQSEVDAHHKRLLSNTQTPTDSEFENDSAILSWYLQRARQELRHKQGSAHPQHGSQAQGSDPTTGQGSDRVLDRFHHAALQQGNPVAAQLPLSYTHSADITADGGTASQHHPSPVQHSATAPHGRGVFKVSPATSVVQTPSNSSPVNGSNSANGLSSPPNTNGLSPIPGWPASSPTSQASSPSGSAPDVHGLGTHAGGGSPQKSVGSPRHEREANSQS